MSGHIKTMTFLLDRGAEINARTYRGWTMLHTAANFGRFDIAKLALSRGADVDAVYTNNWHGGGDQTKRNHHRPLHYAVWPSRRPTANETSIIELLAHQGKAQLSAQDDIGATPIHYAVFSKWAQGLKVVMKYATIADLAIKDKLENTALDYAERSRNKEMADIIKAAQSEPKSAITTPNMRLEETFP